MGAAYSKDRGSSEQNDQINQNPKLGASSKAPWGWPICRPVPNQTALFFIFQRRENGQFRSAAINPANNPRESKALESRR